MVKNTPANAGNVGLIPGLGEKIAAYSSILAWRISWTEEPGYSPWGHKESDTT